MILAIPLEKDAQNSPIALRFARAKYFAIINKEMKSVEILPNPCLGMKTQAGKSAILYLTTRQEVDTLVAYELGLNVQQVAQKNNIQLILINEKRRDLKQLLNVMKLDI